MELPQNAQRIADAFEHPDIKPGEKAGLLGHLQGTKDPQALNRTVDQIIHNGGWQAELVGRIFQRNVNTAAVDGREPGGIRTVDNKKLEPVQKKDAGTGAAGAGELATEEPHTSTANPPASGHEGRTVNQGGEARRGNK